MRVGRRPWAPSHTLRGSSGLVCDAWRSLRRAHTKALGMGVPKSRRHFPLTRVKAVIFIPGNDDEIFKKFLNSPNLFYNLSSHPLSICELGNPLSGTL